MLRGKRQEETILERLRFIWNNNWHERLDGSLWSCFSHKSIFSCPLFPFEVKAFFMFVYLCPRKTRNNNTLLLLSIPMSETDQRLFVFIKTCTWLDQKSYKKKMVSYSTSDSCFCPHALWSSSETEVVVSCLLHSSSKTRREIIASTGRKTSCVILSFFSRNKTRDKSEYEKSFVLVSIKKHVKRYQSLDSVKMISETEREREGTLYPWICVSINLLTWGMRFYNRLTRSVKVENLPSQNAFDLNVVTPHDVTSVVKIQLKGEREKEREKEGQKEGESEWVKESEGKTHERRLKGEEKHE